MSSHRNKHSVLIKTIAMAVVCLFSLNTLLWAYPPDDNSSKSTLAIPSQLTKEEFKKKFLAKASVLMHPAANEALGLLIAVDKSIFKERWEKDRTAEIDVNNSSIHGNISARVEGLTKIKLVRVTNLFNKTGQFAHVGLSGRYKVDGISYEYGAPVIYIDALYYDKANSAALKHEIDELMQWEELRSIIAEAYNIERTQVNMRDWIKTHITENDTKLENTKYRGLNSLQIAERIHRVSYTLKDLYKFVGIDNDKKLFQHVDYDYISDLYDRYCGEEGKDVNIAARDNPKKVNVKADYEAKIYPITKIHFGKLPKETQEILNEIGITDDLIKLTVAVEENPGYLLYETGFPDLRKELSMALIKKRWKDIVKLSMAAGPKCWRMFAYGLPGMKKVMGERFIDEDSHWEGLVKLGIAAGNNAPELFMWDFVELKKKYGIQFIKAYWNELIQIGIASGEGARPAFYSGLVTFKKNIIVEGDKERTKRNLIRVGGWISKLSYMLRDDWFTLRDIFDKEILRLGKMFGDDFVEAHMDDIIALISAAGENARALFEKGFPGLKKAFTVEFIKSHWKDFVDLGIAAGKNSVQLFEKFVIFKNDFGIKFIEKHWKDLVRLGIATEEESHNLFSNRWRQYGSLMASKYKLEKDYYINFEENWDTIVELGVTAGDGVEILFSYPMTELVNSLLSKDSRERKRVAFAFRGTSRLAYILAEYAVAKINQEEAEKEEYEEFIGKSLEGYIDDDFPYFIKPFIEAFLHNNCDRYFSLAEFLQVFFHDEYLLTEHGRRHPLNMNTDILSKFLENPQLVKDPMLLHMRYLLLQKTDNSLKELETMIKEQKIPYSKIIHAFILNNQSPIITNACDLILDYAGSKGVLEGMTPLSQKLQEPLCTKDDLKKLMAALNIKISDDQLATALSGSGFRSYDHNGKELIIPLVFNLLLSAYRGSAQTDHAEPGFLTHAITTAVIHYATKGGEAAKNGKEKATSGANAFHEFDLGFMMLEGRNNRVVDEHVGLAFFYGKKDEKEKEVLPLPEYARKRTIVLHDGALADLISDLLAKQLSERRAKQNIHKILEWIEKGLLTRDELRMAIERLKKELGILKNECGLKEAYYEAVFGFLDNLFFADLAKGYVPLQDNRALLDNILKNGLRRTNVIKARAVGTVPVEIGAHPWIATKKTLLDYLEKEEEIQQKTFEEIDLSTVTLEDMRKNTPPVLIEESGAAKTILEAKLSTKPTETIGNIVDLEGRDFEEERKAVKVDPYTRVERNKIVDLLEQSVRSAVGDRSRVINQGSVGRGTDLPGLYDIDIVALFGNKPYEHERDVTSIVSSVSSSLHDNGYTICKCINKPHQEGRWLISFLVQNASGQIVTKVEITLENNKEAYVDLFNRQIKQVEMKFRLAGSEAVLEDIRLMKYLLQRTVDSYKKHRGGFGGVGAEQVIIQSGGVKDNGNTIIGLGSFAKAMEWIYQEGFDQENRTIRPLATVIKSMHIYYVDGTNMLENANDWMWRRLVHAARVYTEGRQQGIVFKNVKELQYHLEDAVAYRPDVRMAASFDFRGDVNTLSNLIPNARYHVYLERVGKIRHYCFITGQEDGLERLLEMRGASNVRVIVPAANVTLPHSVPKGSPAKLLSHLISHPKLLKEALSDTGISMPRANMYRHNPDTKEYYSRTTQEKEFEMLLAAGIFASIKGSYNYRFANAFREIYNHNSAFFMRLIDSVCGIEYKIGRKNNPLDRYEIPDEKDKLFVKEIVQNVIGIEKIQCLLSILPPATTNEGRHYVIRYNENKLKEYALKVGMDADAFKSLLAVYVRLLRVRLGGEERVELKPSGGIKQPLVSVECYNNRSKTGQPDGIGNINIDGQDIDKDSILRIVDMVNIAFAVSNIPLKSKGGELDQYGRLISFIQNQYRELTGKDISLEEILRNDRIITLPAIRPIPFERLKEYYEFTIKQLEQAA